MAEVYKKKLHASSGSTTVKAPSSNAIILKQSSNSGVIANHLTIRATDRGRIAIQAPSGTIAAHRDARNYVKYLIDRYHDFKCAEVGAQAMKYPVFYRAIQREFGTKWDHIPLERFEELVKFIQMRIDKTILGKNQRAKGGSNYRTFDAYLDEYGP